MVQAKQHGFHGLLHSANLLDEELRKALAPLDIHPRQARALGAIQKMQPVSQVRLAEVLDVTEASMSSMVDRLYSAGFITRQTDPSARRCNVLELTDKGRARLDAIREAWQAMDGVVHTALGPDDAQDLFRLARLLRDRLGGRAPGED